jgi:hypothetical protein
MFAMRIFICLALLQCILPNHQVAGQSTNTKDTVKQFLATVNSFPFYRCTYTLSRGPGVVDPKTFKVTWGKESGSAKCRYATDGEYEAFEQNGNARPKLTKKASTDSGGKAQTSQMKIEGLEFLKIIRGPSSHGEWTEVMENMNLIDRKLNQSESCVFAPLDFGFDHRRQAGPEDWLSVPDHFSFTELGMKLVQNCQCVGLQFDTPVNDFHVVVWFDPARGMIPIWQDTTQFGKLTTRCVVTSARKVSGDRWFPERIVIFTPSGYPDGVTEYVLDDLDADTRPTINDLSITMPAGTVIFNPDDQSAFKLRQAEKVSGHDLPELFEKARQNVQGLRFDTAIEHRRNRGSFWFWICGGLGLLLFGYGSYRWVRNRRKQAANM